MQFVISVSKADPLPLTTDLWMQFVVCEVKVRLSSRHCNLLPSPSSGRTPCDSLSVTGSAVVFSEGGLFARAGHCSTQGVLTGSGLSLCIFRQSCFAIPREDTLPFTECDWECCCFSGRRFSQALNIASNRSAACYSAVHIWLCVALHSLCFVFASPP